MLGSSCGCCGGGWCLVFKSQGWQGWLADSPSSEINGDGSAYVASTALPISAVLEHQESDSAYVFSGIRLSVVVTASSVSATLTSSLFSAEGVIVFEKQGPHHLLDGEVVELTPGDVISNTLPTNTDEYNKKPVDTVGSLFLKLERSPATTATTAMPCLVGCAPNWFSGTSQISTPETMTLQFTNVSPRPSGPRWPSPGRPYYGGSGAYAIGRYAGFLPPNSVKEYATDGPVRTGCGAHMPRYSQPIVLRRVQGLNYTYLSDPVLIKPCARVRYRFDSCPACIPNGTCASQPRLSVYADKTTPGWTGPISAQIFGDYPQSYWNRLAYIESPQSWQDEKDNFVYQFGNFATVSPGGQYAAEPVVVCAGDTQSSWSDSEGCLGSKCPPEEVMVTIVTGGDIPEIAGSYSLPVAYRWCFNNQSTFIPDNYFSGSRGAYAATFSLGSYELRLTVTRNSTNAGFVQSTSVYDECGCDGRPVYLSQVNYGPPNANTGVAALVQPLWDDASSCVPMCTESDVTLTYSNVTLYQVNLGGTTSPHIGTVTVRIPKS